MGASECGGHVLYIIMDRRRGGVYLSYRDLQYCIVVRLQCIVIRLLGVFVCTLFLIHEYRYLDAARAEEEERSISRRTKDPAKKLYIIEKRTSENSCSSRHRTSGYLCTNRTERVN